MRLTLGSHAVSKANLRVCRRHGGDGMHCRLGSFHGWSRVSLLLAESWPKQWGMPFKREAAEYMWTTGLCLLAFALLTDPFVAPTLNVTLHPWA